MALQLFSRVDAAGDIYTKLITLSVLVISARIHVSPWAVRTQRIVHGLQGVNTACQRTLTDGGVKPSLQGLPTCVCMVSFPKQGHRCQCLKQQPGTTSSRTCVPSAKYS